MSESKFVIVGGGMAAGYAAKQFVELGLKPGELTIISADTSIPYERPPLSKGFLLGRDSEESIRISPGDFYRSHGIEIKLGCPVTALDPDRQRLSVQSQGEFGFEKLIVATGSRARTLNVPGAKLANVQYLRSIEDAKVIRQRAREVKRAVLIGGGFIGMEVAAVLAQKNIETTMVMREDRIWKQFFTPEMSHFFESYYIARGVRFVKGAAIKALKGDGAVSAVDLGTAGVVACEMVVAGLGALPETDMLANAGITVADGVMVNEYLETNVSGIFAAGDISNYPDLLFEKRRRVEHWDNAVSQGQHCAKVLMGERAPFRHVPYFFSDVFDLSYEFWGDPAEAGQVIHRGDLSSNSFSVWWLRQGVLVAAFTMNRPDQERELAPRLIEAKQRVRTASLADISIPVSSAFEL
jgi:NADPH-dependent 2,4-dienoyl-CoA reductase/sulfur reductase-like enzyme